MAVCKYTACRAPIERIEGTDTWVAESDVCNGHQSGGWHCARPHAGCEWAPDGRHVPAEPVTIELHPGDGLGDAPWCDEDDTPPHFAVYLIGGRFGVCADPDHVARAVAQAHVLAYEQTPA